MLGTGGSGPSGRSRSCQRRSVISWPIYFRHCRFPDTDITSSQMKLVDLARETFDNKIFSIIFRVPSLDEYERGPVNHNTQYLWQLQVGTPDTAMSSLSDETLDMAIISLDHWDRTGFQDRKFGDGLIAAGYEPVTLADIRDEPSTEGAEIFTVGFPEDVAVIDEADNEDGRDHWEARSISLPVFAFGRVSMLHKSLEYFWSDMSVFEGNSGGPVVEDGKLVGVVSLLAKSTSSADIVLGNDEHHISIRTPLPFARIIKSCYIMALLNEQIRKDLLYQCRLSHISPTVDAPQPPIL